MTIARLLVGISVFWLALSLLFDGLTVLVLPATLARMVPEAVQATLLGLITFVGLLAAMLVQPLAGAASDMTRARWGRRGFLALSVLAILAGLVVFGATSLPAMVAVGYVLTQVAGSSAQAAQQGFIPDLVPAGWRGRAAGLKGAVDVGGAFLAFVFLGSLLEHGGTANALVAVIAVVVVTFVLMLLLVSEVPPREPDRWTPGPAQGAPGGNERPGGGGRVRGTAWSAIKASYSFDRTRYPAFGRLVLSRFLFLLGTYAVGRFFLFYVGDRLGLEADAAAVEAAMLLATLTLISALASVPSGWAADRFGRGLLLRAGAVLSAVGAVLLIFAGGAVQILLFGGLLSLGSAAFGSANWAATTDVIPSAEAARYMAIANVGTAGAAAAAGLAGPLVDLANQIRPSAGYPSLFVLAAIAFAASALVASRLQLTPGPDE